MILKSLLKGLANVTLTLAFFVFCGWWIFAGWSDRIRSQEDPVYAAEFFEGLLPVENVLATRRYHPRGGELWDCTFAIVRLTDEALEEPPSRVNKPHLDHDDWVAWNFGFVGAWERTPAPALGENTRDALDFCAKDWSQALSNSLKAVLYGSGGWYVRGPVGETLFIYAPQQRLAARMRFGD